MKIVKNINILDDFLNCNYLPDENLLKSCLFTGNYDLANEIILENQHINISLNPNFKDVFKKIEFSIIQLSDSLEIASKEGIEGIIQPGGSIKDKEVIDFANENNLFMVFTGERHFLH